MLQCCAAPVRSRRKTYAPPVCIAHGDEQRGMPRQRCGEIAGLSDEWVVPPAKRLSPLQAAQLRLVLASLLSARLAQPSAIRVRDVDVVEVSLSLSLSLSLCVCVSFSPVGR